MPEEDGFKPLSRKSTGIREPEKTYQPGDVDLEGQSTVPQPQSTLASTYGFSPQDNPSHPPRRVNSQRSLNHVKSIVSLHSSTLGARKDSTHPPLVPDSTQTRSPTDSPQNDSGGEDEEVPWGPSHPCFPHPNPHVPVSSPQYTSTRIIRIRRDWMVMGDLAPTYSNIYPEILDPLLPEQEFRHIIAHINKTLVDAYDPFSAWNWLDGVMGLLTGWFWEDAGLTQIRKQLKGLERWIEDWNERVGGRDGVKLISLRRTGYMNLDIQIPDPQVRIIGDADDVDRSNDTATGTGVGTATPRPGTQPTISRTQNTSPTDLPS